LRINQGKVGIQSHSPYNKEICLSARREYSQIHSLLGIWYPKVSNNFGTRFETFSKFGPLEIIEKDFEKHISEIGLHPQFGNKKKQVKWLIN
jgi:hypothetical protein